MSAPVKLAARLDLAYATSLMATLKEMRDPKVVLDLSNVGHLGALCLQVLVAAASAARNEGRTFALINTSDRVLDQLRVMGMTPEAIAKGRK